MSDGTRGYTIWEIIGFKIRITFLLIIGTGLFLFAFADSVLVTKAFSGFSRHRFSPEVDSPGQKSQVFVSNSIPYNI